MTLKKKQLCSFDKIIKNFDKTVTQINQIHCNKFVLVNWKSNHLVVIETK